MRVALLGCSGAVVNSASSAADLRPVLPGRTVLKVDHWADDVFFEGDVAQESPTSGRLRLLYVGRTDAEKFGQCRRVVRALTEECIIELTAVGATPPDAARDGEEICYVPYVGSREELHRYYRWADLTWTPAGADYLARTGVEALASGCPVLVSDIPAVQGQCDGSVRIPRTLIPANVGWIVDGMVDEEVIGLLRNLAAGPRPVADRGRCRDYARLHHSTRNIDLVIDALFND